MDMGDNKSVMAPRTWTTALNQPNKYHTIEHHTTTTTSDSTEAAQIQKP